MLHDKIIRHVKTMIICSNCLWLIQQRSNLLHKTLVVGKCWHLAEETRNCLLLAIIRYLEV